MAGLPAVCAETHTFIAEPRRGGMCTLWCVGSWLGMYAWRIIVLSSHHCPLFLQFPHWLSCHCLESRLSFVARMLRPSRRSGRLAPSWRLNVSCLTAFHVCFFPIHGHCMPAAEAKLLLHFLWALLKHARLVSCTAPITCDARLLRVPQRHISYSRAGPACCAASFALGIALHCQRGSEE